MTVDQFIMLVNAQWERGLIIPENIDHDDPLLHAAIVAVNEEMVLSSPYSVSSGKAMSFVLTRKGWVRFGELMDATVVFI